MRIELILGPSNAKSEGSITIDVSIAILTPNVPPIPIDGVLVFLKNKRPRSPTATVNPEKNTARPAVAVVMAMAVLIS